MPLDLDEISIVHWFTNVEKHRCGYCKDDNGSISHGMWAETMTVHSYQNLIDRGWRRSGKYCYKPIMTETCCPQYTIRCNALKFTPSKSQKKIIKKFNKFCNDGILNKEKAGEMKTDDDGGGGADILQMNYRQGPETKTDVSKISDQSKTADKRGLEGDIVNRSPSKPESKLCDTDKQDCDKILSSQIAAPSGQRENTVTVKSSNNVRQGTGADPNKPPCKKAKLLRLEKKQQKLLQRGMSLEKLNVDPQQKTLEQFLNEISENSKHKLRIILVSTSDLGRDWKETEQIEFELYKKYQMSVHNDPPEKCSLPGFTRFLVKTPLKITTVKMHSKHKDFKTGAQLYKKYQMVIHNETDDDTDESQFCDFLVDTPLKSQNFENDSQGVGYGSFHQQYWLEDTLIAVGVIDILPKCVSSVYFFYDPDYRSLTLGTYGSLRELHFTRTLHVSNPSIEYYYMGFYIHSCPKMLYKGRLPGSDLLCPETYAWLPIEKCIPKLDVSKYAKLNDDPNATDNDACSAEDVDSIKVLIGYTFTTFGVYKRKYGGQELFNNIGNLCGKTCLGNLLFVIEN